MRSRPDRDDAQLRILDDAAESAMNKALPWNVNGVGFDAREAAREAARRQGKSLGEWLHGVISDHADDLGVDERAFAGRQKVEAITSKLERLSARSAELDRRGNRSSRGNEATRRRTARDYDEDLDERFRRKRLAREGGDETELLLEEAIDAMERRAKRAERHTDDAIESFSRLLERSEAQRDREREAVTSLAQKLTDIEVRLADRAGANDDNPIKGALARLESRLERIGRRGAAEDVARESARAPLFDTLPDPLHRLEEKLNSILDVVQARTPRVAGPEETRSDRRLGDAIAEITRRQQSLDEPAASAISLQQALRQRRDAGRSHEPSVGAVQTEIAALAATIETLRRDLDDDRRQRVAAASSADMRGMQRIEHQIADLNERFTSHVARQGEDRFGSRRERFDDLAFLRDEAMPRDESAGLETLVRDLGQKIEATQAPGAGEQALDALQAQVGRLAARFEQSHGDLAKLGDLERSMQALFAHVEETRAHVDRSAATAAREAVQAALHGGRIAAGEETNLALVQALQDDAEARTAATVKAINGTLEKVFDRLSAMETEIAGARTPIASGADLRVREPRGRNEPLKANKISLGVPDSIFDERLGQAAVKKADAKKSEIRKPTAPTRESTLDRDAEPEGGRADFIAAARRAARIAQTDAAVSDLKLTAAGKPESAVRAGLIEQSRDYVARHKRPVLLSLAALFVIVGTMAIMQRVGLDDSASRVADYAAPAHVASMAAPRATSPSDELSPSALPKGAPTMARAIPGSDPIQTGSIPSLPSFAAGAPPARPQPQIPVHLVQLAEAGDGAAEYVLGTQYAEGRLAPRDFALAAKWYQKAAAQNLAPAQYRLASLYEKGMGVAKDKMKAKALYLRAAEAGNPRAMHNLAVLLADGDGKPDYEGAATWFRKAAQYGIRDSQYNLAILLARGIGMPQSLVQSYQWFAVAATQGDTDAGKKRDEVGVRLSANDLAVAKALAASFRPRIADTAATEVASPPGGWDGASSASPLNSAKAKISSL